MENIEAKSNKAKVPGKVSEAITESSTSAVKSTPPTKTSLVKKSSKGFLKKNKKAIIGAGIATAAVGTGIAIAKHNKKKKLRNQ